MRQIYKSIFIVIGMALLQTAIFGLLIYVLERLDIMMITVTFLDTDLIYPYEAGLFFFIFVLIPDIIVEFIRKPITKRIDDIEVVCKWDDEINGYVCPEKIDVSDM
jgi:hypothetical protein